MNFSVPSGPIGHTGIPLALALALRLNPVITVFCGILPDLVDKPLSALLEMGGRYIGHTLLFVILVSGAFFLWNKRYGLAALVGGMSHLVIDSLDSFGFVPWFYPFKGYSFSHSKFNWDGFIQRYFAFSELGMEIIVTATVLGVTLLSLKIWHRHRSKGAKP